MRTAPLAASAFLLLALLPSGAAQPGGACTDLDSTLAFWRDAATRFGGVDAQLGERLRSLNASTYPRLQLGTVTEYAASCDFLRGVMDAADSTRPVDLAVEDVHTAAIAGEKLSRERVVVEPTAMAAGRLVGARLDAEISATPSTQRRIERLGVLDRVYTDAHLDAEAIQAQLWRAAEQHAWDDANRRVDAHLAEADGLIAGMQTYLGAALTVGRAVDVQKRLATDEDIMRSHGADVGEGNAVERIQLKRQELNSAVYAADGGITKVILTTVAAVVASIALVQAARPLVRRMERDIDEVEVGLHGVPVR